MDVTGAVDLRVVGTELQRRQLDSAQLTELRSLGDVLNPAPATPSGRRLWERDQWLDLSVATVLLSYLLHVRGDRLAAFDKQRHPSELTLRQLASLHRSHRGLAGQAFELAVAQAVNDGLPHVTEPLRATLRLLGLPHTGPMSMVLLGLEKVDPQDKTFVYDTIRGQLHPGAVLRTGAPGRPMTADSALARIAASSWRQLREEERLARQNEDRCALLGDGSFFVTPRTTDPARMQAAIARATAVSQLPRADALVIVGDALVPASLKINRAAVSRLGWKDVPLWVTMSIAAHRYPGGAELSTGALCPTGIAHLWSNVGYLSSLRAALKVVDAVCAAVDLGHPLPYQAGSAPARLARQLIRRADDSIEDTVSYLRTRPDPRFLDIVGETFTATPTPTSVPVLDNPTITGNVRSAAAAGEVFVLNQDHLWVPRRLVA